MWLQLFYYFYFVLYVIGSWLLIPGVEPGHLGKNQESGCSTMWKVSTIRQKWFSTVCTNTNTPVIWKKNVACFSTRPFLLIQLVVVTTALLRIMHCNLHRVSSIHNLQRHSIISHLLLTVMGSMYRRCHFHRKKENIWVTRDDLSYIHLRLTRCLNPGWWFHSSAPELVLELLEVSAATVKPHRPSINNWKHCHHQW